MTIKEELAKLQAHDRAALFIAFNDGASLYVPIEDGFVLGVNPEGLTHIVVLKKEGFWFIGTLQEKDDVNGMVRV